MCPQPHREAAQNQRWREVALQFEDLIGEVTLTKCYDPDPPHSVDGFQLKLYLSGGRTKRNALHCALRQDTEKRLHDQFSGYTHVYSVVSTHPGRGSTTAACVVADNGTSSGRHTSLIPAQQRPRSELFMSPAASSKTNPRHITQ